MSLRDKMRERGFVFLEGFHLSADALSVANELGMPITPWNGRLVQTLIPRKVDLPNEYSGIYGFGRFPFHTDLAHRLAPPRYFILRCVVGHANVPTLLVDGQQLVASLTSNLLSRALFRPRRPQNGSLSLFPLLEQVEDTTRFRWDETFINPASKIGEQARENVLKWLSSCMPTEITLKHAGDMLLIDNWRMLHARGPIVSGSEGRKIDRVYLGEIN